MTGKKQDEAHLNSLLATDDVHEVATGSSANWQQLPSYEEAASQLEPPDIDIAGVRRPPKEQWHLFGYPDHAEPKLTSSAEEHDFEHLKHRITSEGNIVTYAKDLHDPTTLEAYLRHQAFSKPPTLKLRCKGEHTENRYVQVSDGKGGWKTDIQTDTIVDFNFTIDLTPNLKQVPSEAVVLSTVMPHEPAYRGSSGKTYDPHYSDGERRIRLDIKAKATDRGRESTWSERKSWTKWKARRIAKGYPTWTSMEDDAAESPFALPTNTARVHDIEEADGEGSSSDQASLHQWCQAYCRSLQPMREFMLKKEVWGWDEEGVLLAVRAAIQSTGYRHSFAVTFEKQARKVMIHPDNLFSSLTTEPIIVFLLWITLIYPFLWLYKRTVAGGRYEVVTASYPLKCYLPAAQATSAFPDNRDIRHGPPETGPALFRMYGSREGDFVREWEGRIRSSVDRRFVGDLGSSHNISELDERAMNVARRLDGY